MCRAYVALRLFVGAPGGLSINGDEIMPVGPHGSDKSLETMGKQGRIDPVHQITQPPGAGYTVMKVTEPAQKLQTVLTPGHDHLEVVTAGDCGAGDQQQHFISRDRPPVSSRDHR